MPRATVPGVRHTKHLVGGLLVAASTIGSVVIVDAGIVDHAATVEASSTPHRIAWEEDEQDVPHISLDKTGPTSISPANP